MRKRFIVSLVIYYFIKTHLRRLSKPSNKTRNEIREFEIKMFIYELRGLFFGGHMKYASRTAQDGRGQVKG